MTARDETIASLAQTNLGDVLEHGPGLRLGRGTWIEARGDRAILRAGLGAFGIGRMWEAELVEEIVYEDGSRTAPDSDDPTYADAPYAPDIEDDFGRTGRSR